MKNDQGHVNIFEIGQYVSRNDSLSITQTQHNSNYSNYKYSY
mgnify:CR=1 FL=1